MVDKLVPRAQMAFWSTVMRTFSLLGSTYGGYALSSGVTSRRARARARPRRWLRRAGRDSNRGLSSQSDMCSPSLAAPGPRTVRRFGIVDFLTAPLLSKRRAAGLAPPNL